MKNSESQSNFEEYTYKSIQATIFRNRRLRVEREDNAAAHRVPDLSAIRWSRLLGGYSFFALLNRWLDRSDPGNTILHFRYGFFVRGALGACSSSDCRYFIQPCMNCGQSGTVGTGSVFSGNKPHNAGWCQQSSCSVLSRCWRMPCRNFFASSMSCSRDILSRSSSMRFLRNCGEMFA